MRFVGRIGLISCLVGISYANVFAQIQHFVTLQQAALRQAPSKDAPALLWLDFGASVRVDWREQEDSSWLSLVVNGKRGYINASYLEDSDYHAQKLAKTTQPSRVAPTEKKGAYVYNPPPRKAARIRHPQPTSSYTYHHSRQPTRYSSAPARRAREAKEVTHLKNAIAICWDGRYSYAQHRRGACSWHGGVRYWIENGKLVEPNR